MLQNSIKRIVESSVTAGRTVASATASRVVADRLGALDEFLADLIDAGDECSLAPFEALFGFLSVGCLSAFVATRLYVTGLAPAVSDLMNAARSLNFGSSSTRIDYRSTYMPFVAALQERGRSLRAFFRHQGGHNVGCQRDRRSALGS